MDEKNITATIKRNIKYIKKGDFDGFFKKVRINDASSIALFMMKEIGIPVLDQMTSIPPYFFKDFDVSTIGIPRNIKTVQRQAFFGSPIKTIAFENGCEELGYSCFENCKAEKIVLPNTITSIPSKCFYNCRDLKIVNLPASVVVIENSAFKGCNDEVKIITPLRSKEDKNTHIRAMRKDVEFIKDHLSKD